MESTPKRKLSEEVEGNHENKKIHSDLEFSNREITAESTLVNDLNNSDQVERIVESILSSGNDSELTDSEQSEVDDIEIACTTVLDIRTNDVESLIVLREQIEMKEKEMRKLQDENSELRKKNSILESEKEVLLISNESNKVTIARYKKGNSGLE